MRDFYYITDDDKDYNRVLTAKKHQFEKGINKKAFNFLVNDYQTGRYGILMGEISYFKDLDMYKEGNIMNRYCDRLFFDFDIENADVSKIKLSMNKVNSNLELRRIERNRRLKGLKADFRNLIFEDGILEPTFNEAKKLCLYLEDLGLKPYLIFSGSKGFHVNVFFDEKQLPNFSDISKSLAMNFSKKLGLEYLDYAVFDKEKIQKRKQRCQYVLHSKTDLFTLPIPQMYDYDEVLAIIKKNKRRPIDFDFDEWKSSEDFSESLVNLNNRFEVYNARRQREKEFKNKKRRQSLKKKFGANYKTFDSIPMEDICRAYGIDGKHQGDRIIVKCPFHNDNNPSAVIFKDTNYFHCSTCNLTLNYWGFIAKIEGLAIDDKSAIVEKLNELR